MTQIDFKNILMQLELAEGLERIGYETITAEEFKMLPSPDKNLVFEKFLSS